MARRPPAQLDPHPAVPSAAQMRHGVGRLRQCIADLEEFNPQTATKRWGPEARALEAGIKGALDAAFGHNTPAYRRYERAATLDHGPVIAGSDASWISARGGRSYSSFAPEPEHFHQYLADGKREAILLLSQALRDLEAEIAGRESELPSSAPPVAESHPDQSRVFIVHGHDEGAREAVARFLEKLGLEAIILHEQLNQGRTVIEKVEVHGDVGFAVVLLTPDDEGAVKGGPTMPRARQNVVLELGYFIGRLGRNHVCALKRGDLELPSDFGGFVYETFDNNGGWKHTLARELQGAGFQIDWNKVMRP